MSNGVISVGSAGKERRITNVEDGSADSDAVTVRQLKNVDSRVNENAQNITNLDQKIDNTKTDLGNQITDTNNKLDDAKKDLGNQITDTNNKLNDTKDQLTNQITDTKTELNNTITNTKTELENKGLNFAGNAGADVHRKLGDKLNIIGGADAATAEDKTSGENVITRTTEDGIKIELLKDAKFDSITTGDSVLNNNGLTIKDGPSITKDGINAGNKTITNVADGVNGKDAVNVDQLTNVKDGLDGKITDTNNKLDDAKKDLGNQITDTNNKLDDAKKDLGNQITNTKDQLTNQITDTKTELNNTITNTKTELENKGLNFAGNAGADVHRKLGDKLNIIGGADAATAEDKTSGENVITRTTEDGIKIELLKDAKFDSITTGDSVLNNNGLTIKDGPSITKDGINAGNKTITNVADGVNGKDAVNVDQLTNVKDGLDGKITDTNNKLDDAKKDLGNQITDTNNKLDDAKKDLGNQITNTKDQLTNQITDTKTELDNTITNTKTELENKGLNFAGNTGADVHRKLGDKLNIVGGADAATAEDKTSGENVITRTTEDGIKIELLKDAKFDSITTGDSVLNNNGLTIKDGPSITKDGINAGNKTITNVADGVNGKDAVNVDQLTNVKDGLDGKITDTNNKLDDAKKDLGNQITNTKDQLTNQITDTKTELNNTITNTKTELENKGLNFAGNAGADVHRKLGDKLNIVGGADAATAEDKTSGENVITRTTEDGIKIELLKDAKFDSITTGDSVLNNNGLTIKDGPSITKDGINAGNKTITNVADGVNGKDAVNVDQLTNVKDGLDGKITDTNNKLDDAKKDLGNQITNTKDQLTNQITDTKTELNNTINNTKTELENKGLNFAGNAGADVHRKLGDKLNIIGGADAATAEDKTSGENVITRTTEDGIKIELLKDAKFDSITTGDSVLNNNGLTIKDGPSITKDGINAGNKVITNVADGSIANGSKDAVNGGQVKNISDSIKNSIGGNTTVNPDGSITTNNIGGTGKNNINDAIKSVDDKVTNGVNDLTNKGLNFAGNAGKDVHRKLGDKLNIVGGADAATAEDKTSGENVITRTTEDGIKIELLKDAKFDSITTGDSVLNNNGLTIKDGPSITKDGINAGNKTITNVANGVNGKDAVNVDQLTNVKDGLDGKITDTNNKLDDAKKDLGNQITNTKDQLTNQITDTKTELNNTITNTKTELENKGLNFAGNAGADVHRKLGDKLNIVGGADAATAEDKTSGENVITRTTEDGIKIELLRDAKFDSITTGDTVLNNNGLTIKDGPSITKDGINAGNKVITNVADGSIANGSKDAVNGGQVKNISDSIKNSIGGNTTVNPDGSITTNNIGGTGKNNINDAIKSVDDKVTNGVNDLTNKGLNFAGNAGKDVHRKLGDKLNIVGGADAATAEDKTSGENVITRTTEDGIKIELLKDAKFDSITTGDSVLNNNGLTIKDGPSITKDGINAGNKTITNVANGVNGKDAVNVDQLTNVKDGLDGKITDTNNKLDDAKKDLGNQITNTKDQLTNQITDTKTELNNTITNTKTELENKGLNFAGNAGADVHRKLGDKLNIVGGADAATAEDKTSGENVITRTTEDGIKIELLRDAKFDSITTGDTVLNNNGLTIKDGPSITKDGINAGNKVITNVADGSIANGSKDAVNGGQVKNISDSIKNSIGGNTTVNPDGSITTNNIGGTGKKNNINDAIKSVDDKVTNGVNDLTNKGLNFAGNAGKDVHRKLGDKLNIVGGADAATAEDKTSGENVITRTTEDGIKIELLKDAKFDSITTGDSVLNNNGLTIKDGPSITKDGINAGNKTITNVADGVNGKDAVNVDQLTNVKDGLDGKITDTNNKLDDAKKDLGNQITNTKDQLTNQITDTKTELNNTINNTKTELENKGLNFAGNTGADVHRKLGDKLNIVGGADAATAEDKTSGENVITRTTEDGIKIELLKDAKFDSITTGDSVLNNNGLTIKDGPSITKDGINAGNKVITNVADGSIANGSKDAVNGGQVKNISDSIKNSIGGNTTVNPDGSITTNNIGGTGKNNINDAIKSVDDKVTNGVNDLTNKGLNFAGNAGKDVHRKLGDKLNIIGGADAATAEDKTSGENVITRTTEDGIKIELLKDAKFDSITTGDSVLNNNGLVIKDGPSIIKDGINAGNKTITNVADAVNGKDAVNLDQLHKVITGDNSINNGGAITNIGGTGKDNVNDAISHVKDAATKAKTTVTEGDNIVVKETTNKDGSTNYKVSTKKDLTLDSVTTGDSVLNNNGLTIKDGPSITKDGINAGNKVITNVADGSIANGSKDAVNGGQVKNISDSIKNSIGGNTTVNPDGSITTNNIGGTGKNNINDAIKSVDDKVTNGVNDLTNKGLNFAGNAGKDVHRKLGDKLNIIGGADAETAEDKTSGENVITRTTEDGIKIELLKDAKFDSITTGDTVLNNNGLVIKNGPSITKDGINAGNKQLLTLLMA
ncbi:hypothetical protein ACFOGQ_12700 [Acinetobacter vivianii]